LEVTGLWISIRAGLHTGECELHVGDVGGLVVHIGERVGSVAGSGEVLVSGTVRDVLLGSGIEFSDRGVQTLKGVPANGAYSWIHGSSDGRSRCRRFHRNSHEARTKRCRAAISRRKSGFE
jgi:class 3 adenylate cyclase